MTTDMFHPAASDLSTIDRQSISASGATDMKQQISTFASLELGDNSSDDGEQLNTPVSESGQLIEIALVCGVQLEMMKVSIKRREIGNCVRTVQGKSP